MTEIVNISELLQGLLIPIFAFILAWQATIMRTMMRRVMESEMQLETIKHIVGIEIEIKERPQ